MTEDYEKLEDLSFNYFFVKEEDSYNLRKSYILYLIVDKNPYFAFKSISFFKNEEEEDFYLFFELTDEKVLKVKISKKDKYFRQFRKFTEQVQNSKKEQNTFIRISNNKNIINSETNKDLFSKGYYKEF